MNRQSIRERMRQAREEGLVEAAVVLLSEKGYAAMTMDDLAASAGVSKATLYQHFSSKEELIVRVVLGMIDRAAEFIGGLDPTRPAIERYEAIVRFILRMRLETGRGIGLSATSVLPVVLTHPEYRRRYLGLVGILVALADEAKKRGDIDPSLPSRVIVQIPVSLLRDAEYGMLVDAGECAAAETIDCLAMVLVRGMRPAAPGTDAKETSDAC